MIPQVRGTFRSGVFGVAVSVLLVGWISGCSDSGKAPSGKAPSKQAPSAGAAKAPAPSQAKGAGGGGDGFSAKLDDRQLAIEAKLAFSRGGKAVHLVMSTHQLGCSDLKGSGVVMETGELALDVTVAPIIEPSGETTWSVTRARFGHVTRQGRLGEVQVNRSNPRGQIDMLVDATLVFPPKKLTLDGHLRASGCGFMPWTTRATVRPQKDIVLTIGSHRVPVNGFSITPGDGGKQVIRVSSEPHACGAKTVGSDVAVVLDVPEGGGSVTSFAVEGYSLPRKIFGKLEKDALVARITGDAKEPAAIELTGTAKGGGYALSFEGAGRAERCDKDAPLR